MIDKLSLFEALLKEIYPQNYEEVFDALNGEKYVTFWVNTLKTSEGFVINELSKLGLVPQTLSLFAAFYIEHKYKSVLTHSFLVEQGYIYIQSLSSMLVVQNLGVGTGTHVLDVCAAPGGKTAYAQLLSYGKIVSTVIDNNINRLLKMKEMFGLLRITNANCYKENSAGLYRSSKYTGCFDRVIADVLCSNLGLIRNPGRHDFSDWNPKISQHLPTLQKKILFNGVKALKKGGTLVYSTCTYHPEENEAVMDRALRKFSNVDFLPIATFNAKAVAGMTKWRKKSFDPRLALTCRILPDKYFDAFYIAKLFRRE